MPLYYFDIDDGADRLRDETGAQLANEHAARDEATRAMGEMAKDYLPSGAPQQNITMWVRNEQGEAILQLALSFAIKPLA